MALLQGSEMSALQPVLICFLTHTSENKKRFASLQTKE